MDEVTALPVVGSFFTQPEIREVVLILAICFVFGGFGGLVAHFINNERASVDNSISNSPSKNSGELYFFPSVLKSICIGIAGALGFLFFMVAVGGITASFQGLTVYLRVISTSVIAGFGARRLLSRMADHLEQQISDAQTTADNAILEAKENEERLDLLETNMKLLEAAEDPSTPQTVRDDAIERGEKLIESGRANSVTWVHLARVYRWSDNLEGAIDALDRFIRLVRSGVLPDKGLQPAYYNRGCYLSLLFKSSKDHNHLTRCLQDLKTALELCSDREKEVALILSDDDWSHLKSEKHFEEIVGKEG